MNGVERGPSRIDAWLDSPRLASLLYLGVAGCMTFGGLGSTGTMRMEAIIAYAARRMAETGQYLVPELYGELYLFKPPLLYWLAAASTALLGDAPWVIRLPGALATLVAGLVVLWLVGRLTRPRIGLYAALSATTCLLWSQAVKLGEFDTVLAAAVGISMAAACHNLTVGRGASSGGLWLLAYAALGAGFLAKGTPALMVFGPGLLVAALATGGIRQLVSRDHLVALAVFSLLAGVYLLVVWRLFGGGVFEQAVDEARHRGFGWSAESLVTTLSKPLVIWALLLPWSLTWPWGLPSRRAGESGSEESLTTASRRRFERAAWSFLLVGMLVFVAVPTHETRYFLPLAMPAGLVAGLALERLREPSRRAVAAATVLALLLGLGALYVAFRPEHAGRPRTLLLVVGTATLASAGVALRAPRRHRVVALLLVAALGPWAAENWVLRPYRSRHRVQEAEARRIAAVVPPANRVWVVGDASYAAKHSSLLYYLGRPVRTFDPADAPLPAGSFVVLAEFDLARLEEAEPGFVDGWRLLLRVEREEYDFLVYRVEATASPASSQESTSGMKTTIG